MLGKKEVGSTDYAVSPEIYDQSLPQIKTAKTALDDFIAQQTLSKKGRAFDAGCRTGLLAEYLGTVLAAWEVIGVDNAKNMIDFANEHHKRENVSFEIEDLSQFNLQRKKSVDFIVCSWVISHIPMSEQANCAKNFFNYLKKDGELLVLFPIMGSSLAKIINEVTTSKEWEPLCSKATKSRVSYSAEAYDELLKTAGFENRQVQAHEEEVCFKNKEELEIFIMTAIARYLPCFEDESTCRKFVQAISEKYCLEMGVEADIPYKVTLLTARAKRLNLANLIQQVDSPIYSSAFAQTANLSFEESASLSKGL